MSERSPAKVTSGPKRVQLRPDNWWQQRAAGSACGPVPPPLAAPALLSPPPPPPPPPTTPRAPPVPAKSPLRDLFRDLPSGGKAARFSTAPGFFENPEEEKEARRDLTPPALRIIKRREEIERQSKSKGGRAHKRQGRPKSAEYFEDTNFADKQPAPPPQLPNWSLEQAYKEAGVSSVPDYYEDTTFVPANHRPQPFAPSDSSDIWTRSSLQVSNHNPEPRSIDISSEAKILPQIRLSEPLYQKLLAAHSFSELPTPEDSHKAQDLEKAWDIRQRKIARNCIANRDPEDGLTELFSLIRISPENRS